MSPSRQLVDDNFVSYEATRLFALSRPAHEVSCVVPSFTRCHRDILLLPPNPTMAVTRSRQDTVHNASSRHNRRHLRLVTDRRVDAIFLTITSSSSCLVAHEGGTNNALTPTAYVRRTLSLSFANEWLVHPNGRSVSRYKQSRLYMIFCKSQAGFPRGLSVRRCHVFNTPL